MTLSRDAAAPMTLTLARHGRTAWHDGNRYTGSSDIPVDDVGRTQAEQLAGWAKRARPDVVVASSMLRAQQTAQPVAEALGLTVGTDHRLRELDFGTAEGRTLAEVRATDPHTVEKFEHDAAAHPLPGGEDPAAAAERGVAALTDLASAHGGRHVLVVCHNTLIRLVLCRLLGVPLGTYRTAMRGMEPTATTRLLLWPGGRARLEFYNRLPEASDDATAG